VRKLHGPVAWAVGLYAALASLFHLYAAAFGVLEPREMRSIHLLLLLPLAFLLFPATKKSPLDRVTWLDSLLALGAFVPNAYIYLNAPQLMERWEGIDAITPTQLTLGTILVVVLLEAARRVIDRWFLVTVLAFIGYLTVSPWLPGFLRSPRAYSFAEIIEMFYLYADEGALGGLTGISSNLLLPFILFAAFMLRSGVGQFFMDLSVQLAGRFAGGPAKVAVISSAMYGTVSGSSVADVYATGSFTIPLMKKIGYKPETAGAIESVASAGGPLVPPIMGAGAFIMSELTGAPYSQIILAAVLPALLYYVGIMATVHFEALKHGIGTMAKEDIPEVSNLWRRSINLLPFALVILLLVKGYSPTGAALYSLGLSIITSWIGGGSPMTPRRIYETLQEGARSGATIAVALACSGIIVACLNRTGVAMAFGSIVLELAGGSLLAALFLVLVIVSVLGTGIPTTPAYIIAVTVGAQALTKLGVDLLSAHLFVFYFAVLSDITPPVAVTALAGAQIAQADPQKTQWMAPRIALAGFLAPFIWVYQPALLMQGTVPVILLTFLSTATGIVALATAIIGFMFRPLSAWKRALVAAIALAAISPNMWVSVFTSVVLLTLFLADWRASRQKAEVAAPRAV
jgi:TRAP transporter 4TM/12TM fusion protein